jgi:hypothetical protein
VISLLSLGIRRVIVLGCGSRPRALVGGRAAEDVLMGGRATVVLGGGRPIGGYGGGRAAELLKANGREEIAETSGRTEAVVGVLKLGRTGAVGLTDVGVTGGLTVFGLTAGPVSTPNLEVEEDAAGRAVVMTGLDAVVEVVVALAGLRVGGGIGLSLLESFVRSTTSRGLPLFLPFDVSAFADPLIVVSSDRSMTRLVATDV